MSTELSSAALESILAEATGREARVDFLSPVGGGSINRSRLVRLMDGRRFFVKSNPSPPPRFFECEAQGLRTLTAAGVLRVPLVVAVRGGAPACLVLEAIEASSPGPGFFARFGRRLAELHRRATAEHFGFERDNYLGATLQPNRWSDDWCEFQRRHRLGYQLDLARRLGRSDPQLDRLADRIIGRLDELIAEPREPASLLHGDLWGGNYIADTAGEAVLVDPAVYYGRREAELAMTRLFGGFDPSFYAAYEEVWPLEPESETRLDVYKLYHLLNHLNLFGGGYRASCIEILRRYA